MEDGILEKRLNKEDILSLGTGFIKPMPKIIESEFWTSKQRKSSSLHEVPYRACFKAEVPRFFIEKLSEEKDVIYDPFAGRGTTGIEAGLLNRVPVLNDINPLSRILSEPRFFIPKTDEVEIRLKNIFKNKKTENFKQELDMFFHFETEKELNILKKYFREKNKPDGIDKWIRFIVTTRLTGHSKGYFSVYTLPPNQAISKEKQIKLNEKLNQVPEYRNVEKIVLNKTKQILRNVKLNEIKNLNDVGKHYLFLNKNSYDTPEIPSDYVDLIITSPPFLDVIQYSKDNWIRCWFNDLDVLKIEEEITMKKDLNEWKKFIFKTLKELYRILKKNKYLIFEVGEIRNGKIKLDEEVLPLARDSGFECESILINKQNFSKTSNIWGIKNNLKGTNTNRLLVLKK